jgi:carboxyl-terminal processing protease
LDTAKIGENALPHCLPYDEVPPASFSRWSRRSPPTEELRRRTVARILKNPEFRYIAQDIVRLKKKRDEKVISLQETKRLAEKKEIDARLEARKEEREARRVPAWKTTEITLSSLDGKSNTVAAVTREVLQEAAENGRAASDKDQDKEKAKGDKPAPDPYFDESLGVLSDYIQMLGTMHAQN